jgi:ABC-type multidrug transport system fused ATPase/permease subunit
MKRPAAISAALRLKAQAERYTQSLAWLISDSVRIAPRMWLRIIVATLLNLGSNAAIAGVIYFYVKLLERDTRADFLGYEFIARQSVVLLLLFVGAMAITMLTFAASDYIAKTAALSLHRSYQAESLRRNLKLIQHLPDSRCPEVSQLLEAVGIRKLVNNYSHSCGWSLRFIGTAIPSLVLFFAGYAAILWMDPETTFVVTSLGLLVVAAQYPVHLLAARSSNVIEETAFHEGAKRSALIELASRSDDSANRQFLSDELQRYFGDNRVQRNWDADIDRYRAMELSALAMQSGGSIVLSAMLLTIGIGLLSDSANWAILIVYVTLLRRLLTSATTIFRTVTVFSRFSPHVQICRAFVVGASRAVGPKLEKKPVPQTLSLTALPIVPGSGDLRLGVGTVFFLANAGGLRRDVAISLQRAIFDTQTIEAEEFPEIFLVIAGSESSIAADAALEKAAKTSAAILLVDQAIFGVLEPPLRAAWKQRLADRYVGIVYPWAVHPMFGESTVLVRDQGGGLHWAPISEGEPPQDWPKTIQAILESGEKAGAKALLMDEDIG